MWLRESPQLFLLLTCLSCSKGWPWGKDVATSSLFGRWRRKCKGRGYWNGEGKAVCEREPTIGDSVLRKVCPTERQGSCGVSAPAPVHWVKVAIGNIKSMVLLACRQRKLPQCLKSLQSETPVERCGWLRGLGVEGVNYSGSESGSLLREDVDWGTSSFNCTRWGYFAKGKMSKQRKTTLTVSW